MTAKEPETQSDAKVVSLEAEHKRLSDRKRSELELGKKKRRPGRPKGKDESAGGSQISQNSEPVDFDAFKNDDIPFSTKQILQALYDNEDGDAAIFIELNKNQFIYEHITKSWYYWNDHHWREDIINNVFRSVRMVATVYETTKLRIVQYMAEAPKSENPPGNIDAIVDEAKSHIKILSARIRDIKTSQRKENILKAARAGVDSLAKMSTKWDTHKDILVVKNGVIDLRTGTLIPGNPGDYMRTCANIPFGTINDIPNRWERFLSEIFDGDAEIINYIHVLLGYGITGHTTENVYPVFYGPGGQNGKTTILETLFHILGEYMYKTPDGYFILSKYPNSDAGKGPDAATMEMIGKRISWSSETNQGEKLDAKRVKAFSGQDTQSARSPYGKKQVQFKPTVLPIILSNYKPECDPGDAALWKRFNLVTFPFSFDKVQDTDNPLSRQRDDNLEEALRTEAQAILSWLVRGSMRWYQEGLKIPEKIKLDTESYRHEEDILGQFLEDCTLRVEGQYVSVKRIYDCFIAYCKSNNFKLRYMSARAFGNELVRRKLSQGQKNKVVDGAKSLSDMILTVSAESEYLGTIG